jgi:peptidyl-prolyl cis-trans isomerase SurA
LAKNFIFAPRLNLIKTHRKMIKKVAVLLMFVGSAWHVSAQNSEVILTVGNEQVTRAEFESIFKKNNREADVSPEALEEYMELFINFKLKVKEAEALGMDTARKFIQELAGYRNQLARPYLTDTDQSEALIREAYDRKKEEIKASHILIGLDLNASPQDTLKAWKKINDIRKKALAGTDFSELAKEHSSDPSAKDNGGSLGYFSALQMVYPFENAAFNTKVGEISKPVRTRFGYHILKVYDRRPSRGEIKVAHIMVRSSETDSEDRQSLAEKQIKDIHTELMAGGVFADLALKYSDDGSSSEKGGQLPMFGAGKMVEEFENAAFALKEDGDISEPVRSRFGWHIIKRLEYKPLPPYEEMESELKMRIAKDTRSELTRKSFVNRLKKEYNFKAHSRNLTPVLNTLDTNIFHGNWDASKAQKLNKPLFEIDGNVFTQADFVEFLSSRQKSKRRTASSPVEYGKEQYEKFEEDAIFDYENSRLEEKYPEFRALMKEYHDGILLFELTDLMVWSMAVKDSVGLEEFYEENKHKYTYKERASGVLYFCNDESIAKKARKMASKGKSQEAVRDKLNKKSNLAVRMESVKLEQGNRPYLEGVEWKKGLSDNFEHNNQVVFFHIHEILPPEPKPLSEVRGLVTAAYQNHLEKEWLEELRGKYNYTVNKDVLYSIQ